jgi:hypothetical protein
MTRKLKLPLEEPYHRLVIDYMNLVIGHNDQSEEYWAKNLKTSLVRYDTANSTTSAPLQRPRQHTYP